MGRQKQRYAEQYRTAVKHEQIEHHLFEQYTQVVQNRNPTTARKYAELYKGDELTMVTIKELKRDNKAALKYLHEKFSFDFQKPVTINEATPPQAAGYPPLT